MFRSLICVQLWNSDSLIHLLQTLSSTLQGTGVHKRSLAHTSIGTSLVEKIGCMFFSDDCWHYSKAVTKLTTFQMWRNFLEHRLSLIQPIDWLTCYRKRFHILKMATRSRDRDFWRWEVTAPNWHCCRRFQTPEVRARPDWSSLLYLRGGVGDNWTSIQHLSAPS